MLGSPRCRCKTFLCRTCRAGSCSGVQWRTGAGGHHGSPSACSSVLPALLGLSTGMKDLTEEKLLGVFSFFKIYGCLKCGGKDTGYLCCQMSPCISLCERRLKFSPRNPPSRLQLGPRGMAPMEHMYCFSSYCFFFSKTLVKSQGAHSRHIPRGG